MTLKQFGQLVKQNPKIRKAYGVALDLYPDEFVGDKYLQKHPQYRSMISANVLRLRNLADIPLVTEKGFFDSWADFYNNQAKNIRNRAATIQYVHDASIAAEATSRGLTSEAYIAQQMHEHEVDVQIRLRREQVDLELRKYWETARLDLDAADRSELRIHYQLNYLDSQLSHLYKRRVSLRRKRDRASKDELGLVNTRIEILQEAFDARKAMVQNPDRPELSGRGSEADSGPDSSAKTEGTVEPVSPPRNRVGY